MFKVERINKIKELVFNQKQVEVTNLSTLLGVSDATIRNDLEELEQEGYLTRFHGGATLNAKNAQESNYRSFTRDGVAYSKNKEELGIIASSLISEREWIFLGPGTTSYYIAKALISRENINVMTNNLMVAEVLSNNPDIQTIILGGTMNCKDLYIMPEDIDRGLHDIYLSKSFFSIDGADLEAGYTLSDLNVLNLIKNISAKCSETIFAVDCTKFGQRSFMKVGDLDFAQTVITNKNIPDKFKKYYLEHDVCTHDSHDLKPLEL